MKSVGVFLATSPRYYPQKETLVWAIGNTFFMQKVSKDQSDNFLGKMFPTLSNLLPRILQIGIAGAVAPPRFSPSPFCCNSWTAWEARVGPATEPGEEPGSAEPGCAWKIAVLSPKMAVGARCRRGAGRPGNVDASPAPLWPDFGGPNKGNRRLPPGYGRGGNTVFMWGRYPETIQDFEYAAERYEPGNKKIEVGNILQTGRNTCLGERNTCLEERNRWFQVGNKCLAIQ